MRELMECGHVANATDGNGNPVCAICIGIHPGATKVKKEKPSLEGRKARCRYCGRERDSNYDLPFFEYEEKKDNDSYYCGCLGWDWGVNYEKSKNDKQTCKQKASE